MFSWAFNVKLARSPTPLRVRT